MSPPMKERVSNLRAAAFSCQFEVLIIVSVAGFGSERNTAAAIQKGGFSTGT
jgi:hypothetical protein